MPTLQATEPFTLNPGDVIKIPVGTIFCRSKNRNRFPETPRVAHLHESDDGFTFDQTPNPKKRSFILFVPEVIRPGMLIHIKWRDGNCACAEYMDIQEGVIVKCSAPLDLN